MNQSQKTLVVMMAFIISALLVFFEPFRVFIYLGIFVAGMLFGFFIDSLRKERGG